MIYLIKYREQIISESKKYLNFLILQIGLIGLINGVANIWGGADQSLFANSTYRFANLALDNALPAIAAGYLSDGTLPNPLVPGWQLSDRPPLQIGALLNLTFVTNSNYDLYYSISFALQALTFWAIYYLLSVFKLDFMKKFQILIIIFLTGALVQNIIFPWPKLLGVGFFLVGIGLFMRKKYTLSQIESLKLGLLLCASLLCHGTHFFIIIPFLVIYFLMTLKNFSILGSKLFTTCLFLVVAYSPWIFFQRLIQPPGTRLLKLHLAGVEEESGLSFYSLILMKYSELDISTFLSNKLNSFARTLLPYINPDNPYQFGNITTFSEGYNQSVGFPFPYSDITARVWQISEFTILSVAMFWIVFWLLLNGISSLRQNYIHHRNSLEIDYPYIIKLLFSSYLFWVLILFIPNYTVLWHGSLIIPVSLYCIALPFILQKIDSGLIWVGIILQLIIFLNIWLREPVSEYMQYFFHFESLVILFLGLTMILVSSFSISRDQKMSERIFE